MCRKVPSRRDVRLRRTTVFGLLPILLLPCFVAQGVEIDRRVYIPSSELGVLSCDGKPGILLTEEEYQRLLQEAAPDKQEAPEIPFPARLESVHAEATLEQSPTETDECLRVRAVYSVRVLSATWGEVPFRLQNATPILVTMDGKWFIATQNAQLPPHLFVHGEGLHTVEMEFLAAVRREAGERRVEFAVPIAPTGNISLRLPGKIDIRSTLPIHLTPTEAETRAELSIGGASSVAFAWAPAVSDRNDVSIPLFAQSHLAYAIKNGLIRITGTVLFSTLMGDIPEQVSLLLPEHGTLRRLEGRGFSTTEGRVSSDQAGSALRGWSLSERKVLVDRSPGKADALELDLEIEATIEAGAVIALPVIAIPDVFRHYGELAIVGDRGMQIRVEQIAHLEPIEIPVFFGDDLAAPGQHLSAYRFFADPVSLTLDAKPVESETEATVGSSIAFSKDAVYRQRYLEILQRKGECRRITFVIPPEEELIRVLDSQDQEIEAAETRRDDGLAYTIELPQSLSAGTGTALTVESRIDPTGYRDMDQRGILVSLRPLRVDEATRMSGTIAVEAHPLLRLTDLERGDLEPAPRPAEHPDALQAFFFRNSYQLRIRVSPKPSRLNAVVLLDLLPKDRFLTIRGEVRYLVEGAGRKQFSLAFPQGLGATFFPEGELIKQRSLRQEDDRDIWDLTTQDAIEGEFRLHFNGDVPMEGITTMPEVSVPDARRERGFIVVEANTETEVQFEASGLAALDILDVPQMERYRPKHRLIGAYQYVVHPYSLRLRVTRHEGEPVLRVMADRLDMMTVVSPGGFARSRATYQIRGVRTAFLDVSLPENSILWSANVGGEPVKPMDGPEGSVRIPIGTALHRHKATLVELVYESPTKPFSASGNAQFLAPRLAEGIPVAETQWRLYLPREYVYSRFDSDLQLIEEPPPETLLVSAAEMMGRIAAAPTYIRAREDAIPSLAQQRAQMKEGAVTWEGYYSSPDLLERPESMAGIQYDAVSGTSSAGDVLRVEPGAVDEEQAAISATELEDLEARGYLGAEGDRISEREGVASGEDRKPPAQRDAAFPRHAGILPFKIQLPPRGVEYTFRGLRQGVQVSFGFRRVDNWTAWKVFLVIAVALIFAGLVREKNALRSTIWAAFILTALPYLIGRDWTAFCNRFLIGILLGLILVFVLRIRKRWIIRAATAGAALTTVLVCLAATARADTVYIPYDPEHPEAATAETRVYVPYHRFEELWRLAKARRTGATEEPAPIDYALEDAQYTLTVSEESAAINARYRLYLPQQKWVAIPFPFSGADISRATLDGQPARIEKSDRGHLVYVREKGSHTVEFDLMARGGTANVKGGLTLGIPPTFASQVRVILPRKDLAADIEPYFGGRVITVKENQKEIVSGLGEADRLHVRWYPEATRDRPTAPPKADVLVQHSIVGTIENWSATVDLSFPGEKKSTFEFDLDETLTLTSVRVPNLRQWTIREQDGRRALQVELSEDAIDSAEIELLAERSQQAPDRSVPLVTVPLSPQTTTRVALFAAPWLDIRVEQGGFNRIAHAVSEIPGLSLAGVFQAHQLETPMTYRVSERSQQIKWQLHYLFQVESRKIEEIVIANMDVKHLPLFGLSIDIPEGYRCEKIEGQAVKDWWVSPSAEEDGSRVDVEFSEGILGPSQIVVVLTRHFPTEPEVLPVSPVALVPSRGPAKSTTQGSVLIASHVSVQPRPVEEEGLTSTSLCEDELAVGDCKVGGGFKVALPLEPKLAYWFDSPDFSASFVLERVEPRESVVWVTLAEAHETWIAYSTHIHWQLRQGSRRAWEFEAPAELGEILVTGKSVREVTWEDVGDIRHYTVYLDTEVFQNESFVLSYESPIQQTARAPHLSFPNAERSSGYILTANASPYELATTPSGSLKPAQKADVPFLPRETGILAYYKVFGGEWDLDLRLIRTVAAETLAATIDWVELETQIRRDGTTLNVASIRMQNKTLQFLPVLLPEGSRLLSLSIAGRASSANRTVRNRREVLLVPLIKTAPGDLSFEIHITYEGKPSAPPGLHQRFTFQEPEILDIPVAQTFWTLYVPEEYDLHYVRGNMEETTRTVREFVKLSTKEEERQRLKGIITGEYDLQKKARAIRNLATLQEEITASQGDLSIEAIRGEARENPRLKRRIERFEKETQRISSEIAGNLAVDMTGEFQSQLGKVSREIEEKRQEIERFEAPYDVDEESREKDWISNDAYEFEVEGIEQPGSQWQVLVSDENGDGLTQLGANVFIQTGKAEEKSTRKAGDRTRESVSQYFNISQSAGQQEVIEDNIGFSNVEIIDELGLVPQKGSQPYSQRVGGRFRGQAVEGPVEETAAELEPQIPQKSLREPQAPPPPQEEREITAEPALGEGSHSILIPFPREGNPFTFKKLKSNAEVRFTALDRRVRVKGIRVGIVIVMGFVLHAFMRLAASWTVTQRLRERMGS